MAVAWPEKKTWKFLLPAAAVALVLTAYRGYRGLGRWSDLGGIIFSELLREKSQEKVAGLEEERVAEIKKKYHVK